MAAGGGPCCVVREPGCSCSGDGSFKSNSRCDVMGALIGGELTWPGYQGRLPRGSLTFKLGGKNILEGRRAYVAVFGHEVVWCVQGMEVCSVARSGGQGREGGWRTLERSLVVRPWGFCPEGWGARVAF